jgi:hypothetical protein
MPYDPAKPANNSPLSAAEMRGQLTSLKALIDGKATPGDIAGAIAGTSNNSNGVADLAGFGLSDPPTQGEVQTILDKLNELIAALRR